MMGAITLMAQIGVMAGDGSGNGVMVGFVMWHIPFSSEN